VQLKPGRWEIRLRAHSAQPLAELAYQPTNDLWPAQEIWVFQANPALRTVQLEGLAGMDPSQTQLPANWQSLPTYLAEPGSRLVVRELHRGDPNPVANQLSLNKDLWLDFGGDHYTVKDVINGSFTDSQRLEAQPAYELGRAEQAGQPLSVTRLDNQSTRGVEIRAQQLSLLAVSRLARAASLPVSGWQANFDQVNATLHLPPGWSLLHASGADRVGGSWIGNWSLWEIFLVLIVAVALGRATSPLIGAVAFATVVLLFQRAGSPVVIWLNFALVFALLPFAKGKWMSWLQRYLWLSFALLLLVKLPFLVQQARQALYPQLEKSWSHDAGILDNRADTPAMYRVPGIVQSEAVEEVVVHGIQSSAYEVSRPRVKAAPVQQKTYDPGQKIQVGPGMPDWTWNRASLSWSGPVTAADDVGLYLAPPWLNRLGAVLAMLLPVLLALLLARHAVGRVPMPPLRVWPVQTAVLVFAVLLGGVAPPADAQVVIDSELLKTLEKRLVEPPQCLPDCASIEAVSLADGDNRLTLTMRVHVAADMAFPLPAQVPGWYPQRVLVDSREAAWLKSWDGRLWVRLPAGRHELVLEGSTAGREQIALAFELPLHNVRQTLRNWRLSGEPNAQQTSQVLQLQREQEQAARDEAQRLLPDPIPPYVAVTRRVSVGLEWTVTTVVERIAPADGVINLAIPLLPGEAPNSGQVNNGAMDVRLGSGRNEFTWESTLKPFAEMSFVAPQGQPWAEVWSLDVSPSWHASVSGIPAVAGSYNLWQPWPGESVTVAISRPVAVEGRQLSIDSLQLQQNVGKRANNVSLQMQMRATQGEHYDLQLPEGAQLQRVTIDGRETPISQSQNRLKIPVNPGSHNVQVDWQSDNSATLKNTTPAVDLGMPATNVRLQMNLPADRWLLLVGGPAMGPALLFWGVLLVVLILAVGLARSGATPLRAYEWILLSLGVATFNLYVLALIAIWFIALYLRGRRQAAPADHLFNLMQIGLFGLSILVLGALAGSIPASLLSRPDMLVTGNGSSATYLQWYQDHSQSDLPLAWAITLPLWIYRVAMLLWALWLAFALMRWLPWAWRNLGVQGYWFTPQKKEVLPPPAP
jgi:hypothetical protein